MLLKKCFLPNCCSGGHTHCMGLDLLLILDYLVGIVAMVEAEILDPEVGGS